MLQFNYDERTINGALGIPLGFFSWENTSLLFEVMTLGEVYRRF